jgi:shikimate dehydrogenase
MTLENTISPVPFVRGSTKVIGVCGHPVTHSLSPAMHNAALAALGLPYIYVAFPVAPEGLGAALQGLHALGIVGVNLTIPHKEAALAYLDEITPEAREVGAVNTIHCKEGRLLGDNTDGYGFYEPLRAQGFTVAGRTAVVLGAGGAARSVAFRLAREGARLCLVNRTRERAERLGETLTQTLQEAGSSVKAPRVLSFDDPGLAAALGEATLLVNTTRVGMTPEHLAPPPVPAAMLHPDLLVYDLVYNPVETQLLQQARERGCRTLTGVKMLVYQGAAAFERWTGCRPPTDVMEAAVLQGLGVQAFGRSGVQGDATGVS